MAKAKRAPVASIDSGTKAAPASSEPKRKASVLSADVQEEIRRRAYELFLQRGGKHGHDAEDWARAEAEVLARFRERSA